MDHNHASCDQMARGVCPACDVQWREFDAHEDKLYLQWLNQQATTGRRRRNG